MRFAVISNIQGNAQALRAVLEALDARGRRIDTIVSAGDIVGLGPSPNEVIDILRDRSIDSALGNYDQAVAIGRAESGTDFATEAEAELDAAKLGWTRNHLLPNNLEFLQNLPQDLRLSPGGSGTQVTRNRGDERTAEYKRTFFFRAMFGGMFRTPVSASKRVLVVHGSPRAANEFIREDTATSILGGIARETQADVLVTGHSGALFRREAHGITFIGAGSVSGPYGRPGVAEYVIVNTGEGVDVDPGEAAYDVREYENALHESGVSGWSTVSNEPR